MDQAESSLAQLRVDFGPREVMVERVGNSVPNFDRLSGSSDETGNPVGNPKESILVVATKEGQEKRTPKGYMPVQFLKETDSRGPPDDVHVRAPSHDETVVCAQIVRYSIGFRLHDARRDPFCVEQIPTLSDQARTALEGVNPEAPATQTDHFSPAPRCRQQHRAARRKGTVKSFVFPSCQPAQVVFSALVQGHFRIGPGCQATERIRIHSPEPYPLVHRSQQGGAPAWTYGLRSLRPFASPMAN